MKQGKTAGILLITVNIILLAVCAVLYLKTDRMPPEIIFGTSDIVYREGMDEAELLEGTTAYDNNDGDVSSRIVIEKIVPNEANGTAVVFYAASDKAGNIAKASRVFTAVLAREENENRDSEAQQLLTAGIDTELDLKNLPEGEAEEKNEEEEGGEEQTPEPTPEPTPTPVPTPAPTAAPAPEQAAPAPRPQPTVNPAAPVLTLKVSEVKVMAGQGPAWVDVIGTLSDDKDNYETLFRNLNVSKYDKNKAGTYSVSVYTEDSDGNRSASVPLNIIVR